MATDIRIVGVKRKAIDEEKLALAFLLLAKNLHDQQAQQAEPPAQSKDEEAA
jgi:hypothetical protein